MRAAGKSCFYSLALVTAFAISGCRPGLPETVPELDQVVSSARDKAKQARQEKNPKTAKAAAKRAERAVSKLKQVIESTETPSDEDKKTQRSAVRTAQEARRFANLAQEDEQLDDAVGSWKAKGYRTTRTLAWKGAFKGLGLAANQVKDKNLDTVSPSVKESAQLAAGLAEGLTGRKRLADGKPDFSGIATDMNALASSDPPARHSMFLALAFLVAGRNNLALYEIESAKLQDIPAGDSRLHFQLLHAVIYSMNDMQHLAVEKIEQIPKVDRGEGEELLAGIHLVLAFFHMKEKNYPAADRELVRSIQIWPNNSVSVFLTGEKLAATGEYEKAANSLQAMAKNADQKWFAKRIAERARQLRDDKAGGQSLIHDKRFLARVAMEFIWANAEKTESGAEVKKMVDNAQGFGKHILGFLPGADAQEESQDVPRDDE